MSEGNCGLGWGIQLKAPKAKWVLRPTFQLILPYFAPNSPEMPHTSGVGIFTVGGVGGGAPHASPKTPYPKTLLLAYLVQRYARLGCHANPPYFLAFCISNTSILGIQKHQCWHFWCRGMCAWGATPAPHTFWNSAFQTHPYWVSQNTIAGICGAEVCTFGAPRQNPT